MKCKYNLEEVVSEVKCWFAKSIIPAEGINFGDTEAFTVALETFEGDYLRYFPSDKFICFEKLCLHPPLLCTFLYRIARLYYKKGQEDIALKYSAVGRCLSCIEIYYTSDIGKSFQIYHGAGTVIGKDSKIGDNVTIYQNVTIGEKNGGRPFIGNNVIIYGGSMV